MPLATATIDFTATMLEAEVDASYAILKGTQLGTAEHTEAAAAYNQAVDSLAAHVESKKATHMPVMAPKAALQLVIGEVNLLDTRITTVDQVPQVALACYGD